MRRNALEIVCDVAVAWWILFEGIFWAIRFAAAMLFAFLSGASIYFRKRLKSRFRSA